MSTLGGARWQAANAELDRALDLSGEARLAWLASLRARSPELAADVQKLLDQHEAVKADRFLEAGPDVPPFTRTGEPAGGSVPTFAPGLTNGAVFGPYQIVRPLGHGGMGTVYEADEIESGRRVALKVLAGSGRDERERERFEREGRLAASVNHPHCVFVFAASEIDGHPVIAMEVMQATLADRVKRDGPLAPAAAVDVILQLVAGLQAAGAVGILHRDVKPSNCFVDAQGVVKIGDFGISRSQRPSEETALSTRGRPAATPAYASPEQLRGSPLDVRSDIYSLGATLYELLTGRRPFEADDLMALLMAVANDVPRAPSLIAPAVPKGLGAVVLRCLAKQSDQRFADYDSLAAALEPYASTASTPATLGRRCLAGTIDSLLLSLAGIPVGLVWGVNSLTITPMLLLSALEVLYYAGCESRWGATPGKAFCRLVIVQDGGAPARMSQVTVRALLYIVVPSMPSVVPTFMGIVLTASQQFFLTVANLAIVGVLFSTARRRNGYTALHDIVSRTRVVERQVRANRRTFAAVTVEAPRSGVAQLGPFALLGESVPGMPEGWRSGYDRRLRRPVWIREVPPGTPPISLARRAVNRPTRLRWLAGRRNDQEAWDAFEAVQGVSIAHATSRPRPWAEVRWWLLDLARECAAQTPDETPPRRLDRIWILHAGGAKLLDDPAIDQGADGAVRETRIAPFLLDVVRAARGSVDRHPHATGSKSTPPWPLGAHQFFERLIDEPGTNGASIADQLETITRQRAELTRGLRVWSMAIPMLFPTVWALATFALFSAFALITFAKGPPPPDVRIAARLLGELDRANLDAIGLPSQDRQAIEVALATRYRKALTDERVFGGAPSVTGIVSRRQKLANDVLQRRAANVVEDGSRQSPAVDALIKQAMAPRRDTPWYIPIAMSAGSFILTLFCVVAAALVGALVFRGGGALRLLGLELVTADGRPASRARALARAGFTWAPVLLLILVTISLMALGEIKVNAVIEPQADASRGAEPNILVSAGQSGRGIGQTFGALNRDYWTSFLFWLTPLALTAVLAGAILALVNPSRGIQDRLAGTWIVPR